MKITILSTAYPLRGGIAHFNGLLYKELSKHHDVNVRTFKRQYPAMLFPGKSQLESGDTSEEIPSAVEVDSVNPLNWIKIGLKVKNDAPDLLVFKYWMPYFAPCFGTITKIAKRNKKTKALVICDNVIPHEKKPGDKALTKFFFSSVDYFICMSKKVQEDLHTLKPSAKSKLLFHPVYSNFGETVDKNEAKQKLNIKAEKVILFFGFIRDYKGLDTLLQSISEFKELTDYKVVVAGEFYTDENKYRDLIQELGIEDKIMLFSDFIPTSEVKYYFSAADVVVLPYKDATQSGIVQIANNFGKPVIATNVGGLVEIIDKGKTGYLVDKDNPENLARTIEMYYSENKEAEFSANIEQKLNEYSWEKFVGKTLDFIKKKGDNLE